MAKLPLLAITHPRLFCFFRSLVWMLAIFGLFTASMFVIPKRLDSVNHAKKLFVQKLLVTDADGNFFLFSLLSEKSKHVGGKEGISATADNTSLNRVYDDGDVVVYEFVIDRGIFRIAINRLDDSGVVSVIRRCRHSEGK